MIEITVESVGISEVISVVVVVVVVEVSKVTLEQKIQETLNKKCDF